MPTTSIYGITYPAATDLVANGYSQMQTLAGNVETVLQNQTQSLSTGFRNQVENPTYSQNQRPAATTSVADYWNYYVDSIVGVTNTRNTVAPVAGLPEWVTNSLSTNVTASTGVGRYVAIQQKIPEVRNLANSTVVVSFYAKAASGTPKVGINLTQNFGTGGSPSAEVVLNGQAVTISTTWARYSVTFTLASVVGKTFGTAGDDHTIIRLWHSAGSSFATQAGSIGNQIANIEVTGVQVERSYITPLELRPTNPNWSFSSDYSAWNDWTPQIQQGATQTTTITTARYAIIGKTCFAHCLIAATTAGTAGNAIAILSNGTLPAPKNTNLDVGAGSILDQGVRYYVGVVRIQTGPNFNFFTDNTTAAVSFTLANTDNLRISVAYEIA